MKTKSIILIVLIVLGWSSIFAQNKLSLNECYQMAYSTAVLSPEKGLYMEIWKLKDANITKGWLPTVDLNGNFMYNSSVVDMTEVLGSLPFPGINDLIKPLPHEQYKITLDVNQMIYDGGSIKSARDLEAVESKISEKQNEIDLYKLRGLVNGYFFNLLLLDKHRELLLIYHELITKKVASLGSAVDNGVILKTDIDVLTSERLKLEQQIKENSIRKSSLLKILSDLIGSEIDSSTQLIVPVIDDGFSYELSRPELQLFQLRNDQLDASMNLLKSKRLPKAFGFVTFGYGNPPGSNFFKDEFAPYFIAGAGVKWNIFDWNKVRNERQIVSLQQKIIEGRRIDLNKNLTRALDAKSAEISSLTSLVETDTEIIALRKRITAAAESQYTNGIITATQYMNELNAERQAIVNHEIHKINLTMARVDFLNISGKEIVD